MKKLKHYKKLLIGKVLETGVTSPIGEKVLNSLKVIDIKYSEQSGDGYYYQITPKWENEELAFDYLERVDFDDKTLNDMLEKGIAFNTELPILVFWRIKTIN